MTVDEIKEMLNETNFCRKRIKLLEEKIAEKYARAEKVTPSYSLAPGGASGNGHLESDVIMALDMVDTMEDELKVYKIVYKRNVDIINRIPDHMQRTVLLEHFAYGNTFEVIAFNILAYSVPQVYRFYNAGLQYLADNYDSE